MVDITDQLNTFKGYREPKSSPFKTYKKKILISRVIDLGARMTNLILQTY